MNKKVVIVGAGWNGVGVAASLNYYGVTDFVVLEKTELCGGFWKYHTYESVRMHTPGKLYKSPEHLEKDGFFTRDEVPEYLTKYAEHHGVLDRFRFQFEVTKIVFEDDRWVVSGIDLVTGGDDTYFAEYLCIATSYARKAFTPDNLAGGYDVYKGLMMHSDDYKNPGNMSGCKKILIIGGGHSSSEIATELYDSGYQVAISHRGGQYFMNEEDWTPFMASQTLDESLKYWGYNMYDEEYSDILDHFDNKFSKLLRNDLNEKLNWKTPDLPPARFIILNKKTFIDESHFLDLIDNGAIEVRGPVDCVTEDGVKYSSGDLESFDGIILTTGFRPELQDFLENTELYMRSTRHSHLGSEKFTLPITDGRSKSTVAKNLFFPGFDYGITQRVEFGLQSWYVGERIAQEVVGIEPELDPLKFKKNLTEILN